MNVAEGDWILLLDDDAVFRGLLADLLTANGYSVYEARSSADATEAVKRKVPALAIVDYRLPDMDGITWIARMREARMEFPMIFLSGTWCDLNLFNRLRNLLKVSLILQKPIEPDLFIEQIRDLLPSLLPPAIPEDYGAQATSQEMQSSPYNIPQLRHPEAVEEALSRAKRRFAIELPERLQRLSKAVKEAKEDLKRKDRMLIALDEAHKLKGSAGSFGFNNISELAGKLGELLRNLEPDDSTLQEILWSEIIRDLAKAEATAKAAAIESGGEGTATTQDVSAHTIVMLSDQATCEKSRQGIDVEYAEILGAQSANEAQEIIQSRPVQAVVIDLSVCNKSSALELMKQCRTTSGCENLALIAVCDQGEEFSSSDLLYLGASEFLKKPFHAESLTASLRAVLNVVEPHLAKILTVDDDPAITKFIKTILTPEGMNVRALHEPIKILSTLEEFQPDAILLDVIMPGLSGYDVCRMLRAGGLWSDVPIVFLTSRSDTEGRNFAFKAGASDFLAKPILSEELVARVKAQIDHSPRARKRYDRDPETGLIQRAALERLLDSTVATAQWNKSALVFCLMQVDNLDELRKKQGIAAADQVLSAVGKTLLTRFRADDIKAQLADLYVIIFPQKTSVDVQPAMELLSHELAGTTFESRQGDSFAPSVSFGLSELYMDTDNGIELLGIALERLRSAQKEAVTQI
jgi:diguanylate cyclase (GGDEF)-like protein